MESDNYVGTTAAYEDGNGNGMNTPATASLFHAWLIVVGSVAVLWFLALGPFRNVTQ